MKILLPFILSLSFCFAQGGPPAAPAEPVAEDQELSNAVAEVGNSPIEFVRVLEKHLAKYPDTKRKPELERALVKAAIESKDDRRIILYGERVLARESDDLQILDRVTRALLVSDARDTSERALKYAKRYSELITGMRKEPPAGRMVGQWTEELDRALGRALALEARATGNLGKLDVAVSLSRKGYEIYPSAESAREIARWLRRQGKEEEAVVRLADAFAIADPRIAETDRARDRATMGEIYIRLKGSEKGLGDIILEAYDRTSSLLAARRFRLREIDPNSQAGNIMDFTLSGPAGEKLSLASLKGKTVVFDFWATWCGPCRAQHPLYEEVKRRFRDDASVVFLSVSTDEDRDLIVPFLQANRWEQKVWFEDGLAHLLQVSSIPTTIIVDRRGEVVNRMNGYIPDRFVNMLSERIREALKD